MYEEFRGRGVVFIGLTDQGESELAQVKAFLVESGITWPNGYGAAESLQAFGSTYIPAVWVIGSDGKVVWNDNSSGTLEDGIDHALSLQSAE